MNVQPTAMLTSHASHPRQAPSARAPPHCASPHHVTWHLGTGCNAAAFATRLLSVIIAECCIPTQPWQGCTCHPMAYLDRHGYVVADAHPADPKFDQVPRHNGRIPQQYSIIYLLGGIVCLTTWERSAPQAARRHGKLRQTCWAIERMPPAKSHSTGPMAKPSVDLRFALRSTFEANTVPLSSDAP